MKTGEIVGLTLVSAGLGLAVYYGFIHKFSDGLTFFPHLKNGNVAGGGGQPAPNPQPTNNSKPPIVTADTSIHDLPSIAVGDTVRAAFDGVPVFGTGTQGILYTKSKGEFIGNVDSFSSDGYWANITTTSQKVKVAAKQLIK